MTKQSGFKRRVRARMVKTGETYTAARSHLDQLQGSIGKLRSLHLTNGESAAISLRHMGLDGPVVAWADALHDGPVPGQVSPSELRRLRANYLRPEDPDAVAREFARRDEMLEANATGTFTLWFEADLYDQLQLVQILHRLSQLRTDAAAITLICIGEHRGFAHFGGLGELTPDQLAGLHREAVQLSPEAMALAVDAWQAFTAPQPDGLMAIAMARSPELRFTGEAFGRLMQEYPAQSDGLSLTERRILLAAAESGATVGGVFRAISEAERRPFLADLPYLSRVESLAKADHPLLRIEEGDGPDGGRRLSVMEVGRSILAGEQDHARLNGLDRWIGGVHLTGHAPQWRYDERLERLRQLR